MSQIAARRARGIVGLTDARVCTHTRDMYGPSEHDATCASIASAMSASRYQECEDKKLILKIPIDFVHGRNP
jgi:hypothetical protein